MATVPDGIGDKPVHYADCCMAISRPLIRVVTDRLPRRPAMILSVGSGSGLLEAAILEHGRNELAHDMLLHGVEVPSCTNKYLPNDRLLRVPTSSTIHEDAASASALMFVYPRQVILVAAYLDTCKSGVLEQVLWLGHRSDWADYEELLSTHFKTLEYYEDAGVAEYELLVIAIVPRAAEGNVC